jgi:FlaA1/EpsC-like NDP-sugar epimerase
MTRIHFFSEKILNLPRPTKRIIAVLVDIMLCIITVALAYRLRLDAWIFPSGNQWLSYAIALLLALPIFITSGLYRAIFRYVGWHALGAVTRACMIYGVIYALIFTAAGFPLVPRSTGLLQPILLFLAVGASRAIARYWLGGGYAAILGQNKKRRVLIYGAGSAGRQLAAGLANSHEMQIIGFVDDDRRLHGSLLNGRQIFAPELMADLIEERNVADVLLAIPSTSRQRRSAIIDDLRKHKVAVRTLPGLFELADGKVTTNDLRPLEIEDLLGRDPVPPSADLLGECITDKIILVTGAGGSIGSELCRQIVLLHPRIILLVDVSEFSLYSIHHELEARLSSTASPPRIVPLLASVQDQMRMAEIISTWKPDTIYHAAAYKHVPLVEHNPVEGVRNNVFGTQVLATLAKQYDVAHFILISTDKAVRPTNIMGTTKRLAEMVLQALAADSKTTVFSMVRFGNVLGSSGSVVPLFRKQIQAGGPITITHHDVTRYFMSIPEAAQLVIQAGSMAKGGEVFVLDMGEPVLIRDLAAQMIELSGLTVKDADNPNGDVAIEVIGLRPGEKLYEELLIGNSPEPTTHPRILKANEEMRTSAELQADLDQLRDAIAKKDVVQLRQILRSIVPDFTPQSQLVDWVYLEANNQH